MQHNYCNYIYKLCNSLLLVSSTISTFAYSENMTVASASIRRIPQVCQTFGYNEAKLTAHTRFYILIPVEQYSHPHLSPQSYSRRCRYRPGISRKSA